MTKREKEPIAIIGIGCRFPGGADDPEKFWSMIRDGIDTIGDIPPDRWDIDTFFDEEPGKPGKTYSRWGGFIGGIDLFDPQFFGISSREAAHIDPQHRLLLETAWEALEDGGQVFDRASGLNAGVFIGISTQDYAHIQMSFDDKTGFDTHSTTGGVTSMAANRISYCLNLSGPSIAVDTACSSSLVAVHLACESIWDGGCGMALAGGVNAIIIPDPFIGFCKLSMLSRDGRCKTFDARADGFVRGEGGGVVVLKPLSKALDAGDPIYAVIRATGVNQDGRTSGITLPSRDAQAALLREVYERAGIPPGRVQYVEAHGTGTPTGDPAEASAIGSVMSDGRAPGCLLAVGSVKTNIGHLEAGAGIAGLIKTALCLKHRRIPPNLHFVTPNPYIDFEGLKLRVSVALEEWPPGPGPAYAGVNSFGFGGTNAHVALEEAPTIETDEEPSTGGADEGPHLFPLSARSPEALNDAARDFARFVDARAADENVSLYDLGRSAALRRVHHEHRLTATASNKEELRENLEAFLNGEKRPGLNVGRLTGAGPPKVAFVCSGQGPQWWAMGRGLLQREPVFRAKIEECADIVGRLGDWSLREEFSTSEDDSRMQSTAVAQPAIFSLQVALAALWKSWGISPDAVVGHSVGEVAAAHLCGALSLEDAVRTIYQRGRCMALAPETGRMLAANLIPEEAENTVGPYAGAVSLAAVNSPSSVTLSGDPGALAEIAASLESRRVFCRFLRVNYAFHSRWMDPVKDELIRSLEGLRCETASLPIYSTVTGASAEGGLFGAEYWWLNVRRSVRFSDAILKMIEDGYTAFVELSPHPVLSGSILECLRFAGGQGSVFPSLRRKEDERAVMLGSLGALHAIGLKVDWGRLYPRKSRYITLPSYPWRHESYWRESEEAREARFGIKDHPLLGRREKTADPCWTVRMDAGRLHYLKDHCIQGHRVYPAAAYMEMAFAAADRALGQGPCVVEELEFQKAFFLPSENGALPSLQFSLSGSDGSFHIAGKSKESDKNWTVHAGGRIRLKQDTAKNDREFSAGVLAGCEEELSREDCYARFNKIGLNFGPAFQGIESIRRRDGEAIGKVVAQTSSLVETDEYLFHPALLDSCLQVLSGALPASQSDNAALYLPAYVEQVRFYGRPGARVTSHALLRRNGGKTIEGDIRIYDEHGKLSVEIVGFSCRAVESAGTFGGESLDDWVYKVRPQLKPRADRESTQKNATFLRSPSELLERLNDELAGLTKTLSWQARYRAVADDIDTLCRAYILRAFRDLGLTMETGRRFTFDGICDELAVSPKYRKLTGRYLEILEKEGALKRSEEEWEIRGVPAEVDVAGIHERTLGVFPAFHNEITLIGRCGARLAEVMRGEKNPLEILFPDGSFETMGRVYQDSPSFLLPNLLARTAVSNALDRLPEGRKPRVLEIGAGTGGMTSFVLPAMPADRTEYIFTDLSNVFFGKCGQKLRGYPFVEYKVLDIEKDPLEQGFSAGEFDLVIGSDVLHATEDLRASTGRVLQLLAPGGLLILLEAVDPPLYVDIVFGITEGWWRFSDYDLRPRYPLISTDRWHRLLAETGFVDSRHITDGNGQVLFIARAPEQGPCGEKPESLDKTEPAASGTFLVFADSSGVAPKLVESLRGMGHECLRVFRGDRFAPAGENGFEVSWENPRDMDLLIEELRRRSDLRLRGAVHLWSLDAPQPGEALSGEGFRQAVEPSLFSALHFVQALARSDLRAPGGIRLVTCGAQPFASKENEIAVAQAPLLGLGRVVAMELSDLDCRLIDIGLNPSDEEIECLCREITMSSEDDREREIALRGQSRYVPRLVRTSVFRSAQEDKRPLGEVEGAACLEAGSGSLDALALRERPRSAPGPCMVEIEAYTAGLNFRDVMKALGIYPTDDERDLLLGDECSGRIVAVGEGVTDLEVGDDVVALAPGSLSTHVTTHSAFVVRKPRGLDYDEAVTIPITFLTAYYALHRLGGLKAGERALIHAATGGVGLAAIQVARWIGAEIFATAGNPEKREFLSSLGVRHVMNSRTLAFADRIMEITDGKGVDVVLNSLSGQAIWKGLSVLGPYGRFLEIGKRDIYQNSKLGMRGFRKNLSFFAIDLSKILAERPELIASMMKEISDLFDSGTFKPLPYRLFQLQNVGAAFRHMAQAGHIGKIVIAMRDPLAKVDVLPKRSLDIDPRGTYLVTGGLKGFGLATAGRLVDRGARNLVLLSRSGVPAGDAGAAIDSMRLRGARVETVKADVSVFEDMERVFEDMRRTMPPLRGVIHAAMVMDDGVLPQQSVERFRSVLAPKVLGAWNLHILSRDTPLDFFVLYSSVAATIGNPGQGNYCAANAFLDSFAYYRRGLGLPALTVNWGRIADVGYVAGNSAIGEHLTKVGLEGIAPEQALKILERAYGRDSAQLWVMRIDWRQWGRFYSVAKETPLYSHLITGEGLDERAGEGPSAIRNMLLAAKSEERQAMIETYIRDRVALVLATSAAKLDSSQSLNELGLDSLMAVELKNKVESEMGITVPTAEIMRGPSISELSDVLLNQMFQSEAGPSGGGPAGSASTVQPVDTETGGDATLPTSPLVTFREEGARTPLYCIHPAGGLAHSYKELVRGLMAGFPVYGIQSRALLDHTIEYRSIDEMASAYADAIVADGGFKGPLCLLGHSLGGLVSVEAARILEQRGRKVAFVGVIDAIQAGVDVDVRDRYTLQNLMDSLHSSVFSETTVDRESLRAAFAEEADELHKLLADSPRELRVDRVFDFVRERGHLTGEIPMELLESRIRLMQAHLSILDTFECGRIHAPLHVWLAESSVSEGFHDSADWAGCAGGEISVETIPGDHFSILQLPYVETLRERINECLKNVPID